jgi:DNA-binding transcriptional LysR family regulator
MRITLRQLQVFAAIAQRSNVTLASQHLFLSQAATSMALADLERQIDCQLFDRQGKRLLINETGRLLLPHAIELLERAQEFERLARKGDGVPLHLGASSTVGNYLLPRIMGLFMREQPESRLSLEVANTEQIIGRVLGLEIDLGLIEGQCHDERLEVIPWRSDELVLCCAPDNPLLQLAEVSPEDLVKADWILREPGSGTREYFEQALSEVLPAPVKVRLELGHTEAIKQAVAAGLGISCLSRLALAESLAHGSLAELATPFLNLHRQLFLLVHKDKYRTNSLNSFIQFCQKFN